MKITLLKKASWGGKSYKSGSNHDVDPSVANKLISRGYARVYVKSKEAKDGSATD
jgi:hypothetical protein